jgi:branched-chain amino acid transport system ATP-binding protein
MLELDRINTFFGLSHILHDVSLKVGDSEIVALLGRNGVGKTTTLKSIIGVVKPRSGRIRFVEEDITNLPVYEIIRRRIVLIPEDRRIFPGLTVTENLQMGFCNQKRISSYFLKKKLEEAFALFPRLGERKKQLGGTLSGGEQQMLAIGRGLMGNARLMLLDEPSEGLAPFIISEIIDAIRRIAKGGNSILLVEQNARLALTLATRGYIMEKGAIVMHGTSQELGVSEEAKSKIMV